MKFRTGAALLLSIGLLAGCQQTGEDGASDVSETAATPPTESTVVKSESTIGLPGSELKASKVIKDEREGIVPDRIRIPAIDVDATIQRTPLLDNGQMGVPDVAEEPGWYEQGYLPGEPGNAVIAGHVDWTDGPAVFYDLNKLKPGDEVVVESSDGTSLTFVVQRMETYPMEDSPVRSIFGFSNGSHLNLITCTGDWNKEGRFYEDRLVVYTTLKNG